jgi:CheY-like chemotaxis protein
VTVIGISGDQSHPAEQTAAAAAAGMDGCLVKPVSPRMLAEVLARVALSREADDCDTRIP